MKFISGSALSALQKQKSTLQSRMTSIEEAIVSEENRKKEPS